MGKEIPWQEQCMLTELMVKYVPKHITQILPDNELLSVEWDNEYSFKEFIQEELYLNVISIISRYGISVEWN